MGDGRVRRAIIEAETYWELAGRPVKPAVYSLAGAALLGVAYWLGRRKSTMVWSKVDWDSKKRKFVDHAGGEDG